MPVISRHRPAFGLMSMTETKTLNPKPKTLNPCWPLRPPCRAPTITTSTSWAQRLGGTWDFDQAGGGGGVIGFFLWASGLRFRVSGFGCGDSWERVRGSASFWGTVRFRCRASGLVCVHCAVGSLNTEAALHPCTFKPRVHPDIPISLTHIPTALDNHMTACVVVFCILF